MFQHKMRLFLQVGLVIAGLTVLFGCTSMVGTGLQTNSAPTLTDELSTQILPEAKTANFRQMTIQPACLAQKEVHGALRRAGINKALKDPQVRQIFQDLAAQGVRFDLKTIKIQAKVLRQGENLWVLLPLPDGRIISYESSPSMPIKVVLMDNSNKLPIMKGDAVQALMAGCDTTASSELTGFIQPQYAPCGPDLGVTSSSNIGQRLRPSCGSSAPPDFICNVEYALYIDPDGHVTFVPTGNVTCRKP